MNTTNLNLPFTLLGNLEATLFESNHLHDAQSSLNFTRILLYQQMEIR